MYYYLLLVVVLVSGCASSVDHGDKFTPHRLNGTMYQVTDIKRFSRYTIRELDKYKKGVAFGVGPLVHNQFESPQYGSETPKNLNRTAESILTEVIDGTSHYQLAGNAVCSQNATEAKIAAAKSAFNPDSSLPVSSPSALVDMVISGEYSWYEKNIDIDQDTKSPIFTGTSTDIDITLGSYNAISRASVSVDIINCRTKRKYAVQQTVDIFERSSDRSFYLFSNQFGIVWISKEKHRGSVNVAMEEAFKVGMLKAIVLATGKTLNDIENFINFPKIIRESLDTSDQRLLSETLEFNQSNVPTAWRSLTSGNRYTVIPRRTYYRAKKQPCREFSVEAEFEGKVIGSDYEYIVACRE